MSGVPSFDRAPGAETDICLIVEGCYPHVAGGVSGWLDWLMRVLPELTFTVISIVSGQETRTSKYGMPGNLVRFLEIDLQPPSSRSRFRPFRTKREDVDQFVDTLVAFTRDGQPDAFARLVARLGNSKAPTLYDLTQTELSWHLVCGMYERLMPHAPFLDFFWAWRSLIGGLFATIMCPLPRARIYHTISTGYAGLLAARAAVETGRRTLITEHGIYTNERRIDILMADWIFDAVDKGLSLHDRRMDMRDLWITVFESYARACYAACDTITTLYRDNQALQVRLGAEPDRLAVIPNGIDVERFAAIPRPASGKPPTMALIGRVVPIKDIKTFIAAAATARRAVAGLRAVVLGPLEEDPQYAAECQKMVEELDLRDTVSFEGRVDVMQWLSSIHVVVLTSLSEAQPLTVLEAGAAGIPCVTTNVGSCQEILLGPPDEEPALGAGGIVTDVVEPEQIAEGVVALLRDDRLRQDMGRRLQQRVRRFYSSDMARDAYRQLYSAPERMTGGEKWPA